MPKSHYLPPCRARQPSKTRGMSDDDVGHATTRLKPTGRNIKLIFGAEKKKKKS